MDFGTAILYVLAVIAIIAVAGLIIYVLAALIVSIIDKKEVKPFGSNQEKEAKEKEQLLLDGKDYQLTFEEEKPAEETPVQEEAKEVEGDMVDLDLADEEEKELAERRRAIEERNEEPVEEEVEEEDDLEALYQKLINDINSEAAEEEAEEVEEPVEETEEVVEEEVQEEPAEEEVEEPAQEEVVEEVVEEPQVDEEKEDLKAQLAALQAQLAEEQAQKDELAKQLAEKPEAEFVEVESESLESLNARREVLAERLAESEKELRANKKEFVPLAKIKKNLETDKAKLRRKEAVVAKQKVMLFGVNNYVVDPEKEKKLSEDLDVLDALRLSVQHCEEVMSENEDRYPILEKTNAILTKQVEDLRADVADIDARIAKLQGEGNGEPEGQADAE